jgi:outer membrane receptor protein involved in Fe transport
VPARAQNGTPDAPDAPDAPAPGNPDTRPPGPDATRAPAVDIAYLPPLPAAEIEEQMGQVTVAAALQAEEDVVVGAARREQSLGDVASAVTVITRDRLRRFGYRTVAEALHGVAGMFVTNDRQSLRLGVRGLQILADFNTRILVLIDGATITEPWGQFAGIDQDMPVSIDEIDRIEVIRGPVSSVYGTNAFFGIINIVTRSADRAPAAFARVGASTFAANTAVVGFAAGDVDRQVRGSVAGTLRFGEDLEIPALAGTGEPTATSADGQYVVRGGLVAAYDGAFLQVRAYRHQREVPGAPYGGAVGDERNVARDNHVMVEGSYARDLGTRVQAGVRAYVNRYRFEDYIVYEPDEANYLDFGDALWIGTEARARLAVLASGRLGLTAGAEVAHLRTASLSYYEDSEAAAEPIDTIMNTLGLYGEIDAAPTSWLSLAAGARLDVNSILPDNLSPRAALFLQKRNHYGLKLLYAEGFRNPSSYEAFFADDFTFVPDPDIGPERIRSLESVLWGRPSPGLDLRLSGFAWQLEDLIDIATIPNPEDPASPFLQFQNLTSGSATGLEFEAGYRNLAGWYGFAGTGVHRVRIDAEGGGSEEPPNAPLVTANLGASTPLLFGLGHVSTDLHFVGARRTRDETIDVDPFLRWNVTIHAPDLGGFDLTIGVRNLLGVREQVPLSADFDRGDQIVPWLPGEAREFHARLGRDF